MSQKSLMLLASVALVWYFLKQKREEKLVEQAFPGEDKKKNLLMLHGEPGKKFSYVEDTIRDYTASRY